MEEDINYSPNKNSIEEPLTIEANKLGIVFEPTTATLIGN